MSNKIKGRFLDLAGEFIEDTEALLRDGHPGRRGHLTGKGRGGGGAPFVGHLGEVVVDGGGSVALVDIHRCFAVAKGIALPQEFGVINLKGVVEILNKL